MAYAILRTEKYKTQKAISGLVGHHLRIPGSKLDNVDLSRSHLNVVIGAHDRESFNKAVRVQPDPKLDLWFLGFVTADDVALGKQLFLANCACPFTPP